MRTAGALAQELAHVVERVRDRAGVPGVTVCAAYGDLTIEAAAGVANLATGEQMTPDTLFLIGSISKIYTTSVVMKLVESGQIDLDVPVRRYIPDFRIADAEITEVVTMRHLLTHSSGIDGGSYCFDGGRGADGIARYIESCASLGRLHAPGQLTSYCNAGFVIAGRAVELVTGHTFDEAQRELLLAPLGTETTCTLPENAILHRAAVGHMCQSDGTHRVTRAWMYNHAAAPCGTVIAAPARDVIAFARMHLRKGEAASGARVLSAESVQEMRSVQHPDAFGGSAFVDMGLPWMIGTVGSTVALVHSGGSPGGVSQLQVVPERDFAVVVFCNSSSGWPVCQEVVNAADELFLGLVSPPLRATPVPGWGAHDFPMYVGSYERWGRSARVSLSENDLTVATVDRWWAAWFPAGSQEAVLAADTTGTAADSVRAEAVIVPIGGGLFVRLDGLPLDPGSYLTFTDMVGDGQPKYLFDHHRAHRRTG